MPLLVDPSQSNTSLEFARQNPVRGLDPGFVERFEGAYGAMVDANNVNADQLARGTIQSEFIHKFYQQSGQRIQNWMGGPLLKPDPTRQAAAQGQFEAWKKQNPNSDLVFPDEAFVSAQAVQHGTQATRNAGRLAADSTSWSSTLGGIAGTAVGAMRDPLNAMTMGLGAGAASGIVRTALTEASLQGGAQALNEGLNYDFRTKVDPNFGVGDAAYEIGSAALGGAVLGGGVKGVAALWDKFGASGRFARPEQDAANVLQREAAVPSYNLDQTVQGKSVYRSTVDKASDDLFAGQPVSLPPEAFLEAQARPGRVYDADGRSVGVRYELAEADSLTTSHNDDMSINSAFPQELQPRDRTRAMSQDQVQGIASNLQPERLGPSTDAANGSPIIGPDDLVESGNGRVMALRRAYDMDGPGAQSYRNYLTSQGYEIGDMAKPVLIARRVTDLAPEERLNFVTAANRSTAMRLSAGEQALSDGRMIDEPLLDKLKESGVNALSNRDFVRGFMSKLPRAEQAELVDRNGVLSQAGERRVTAALMGRAYGDTTLLGRALEDTDNNIKSIAGAMSDAGGSWAQMRDAVARGQIPRGMDITNDLLDAVRGVMRARDEGQKVKDIINQGEMFGGPSETAKILARAMFGDADLSRPVSRARLSKFLDDYASEAMKNDAGPRLFGDPLDSSDVLRTSLAKAGREDLEAVANERLTPEAQDKIAASPETEEATIMDARRLMADNEERQLGPIGEAAAGQARTVEPIMIDLNDGRGERSLDDIMKEADDEIAAANEIESCVLGKPMGND